MIDKTISTLNTKEEECKSNIKKNISNMQDDIEVILSNDSLPKGMRTEMLAMKESFSKNLEHLKSGKPLEDMPIVIEMVQMGSMEDHSTPFSPTASVMNQIDNDQGADDSSEDKGEKNKKRGFFSRTKEWMITPFDIKWKDIE